MKKLLCIFFAVIIGSGVTLAGNALVTIVDGQQNPLAGIKCVVSAQNYPQPVSNSVAVQWRTTATTDLTGSFTLSNLVPSAYIVFPVGNNFTPFTFVMPFTNGTITAGNNLLLVPQPPNLSTNYPTFAQGDQRWGYNGTNYLTIVVTNFQLVTNIYFVTNTFNVASNTIVSTNYILQYFLSWTNVVILTNSVTVLSTNTVNLTNVVTVYSTNTVNQTNNVTINSTNSTTFVTTITNLNTAEIFLATTNSYRVNGNVYTFSNCDAMLNAAFSDPSIFVNSNATKSVPIGARFKLNNIRYPFETPKLLFCPANYPSAYSFEGVNPNTSYFLYDGPTNFIGTGYNISHNGYTVPNGLITVGQTNLDINTGKVNLAFAARNTGFFGQDSPNTLLLVDCWNEAEIDHCYAGQSSMLTNANAQFATLQLCQSLTATNQLTLMDFDSRADNDLKIHDSLFLGGKSQVIAACDHADIWDNRFGGQYALNNFSCGSIVDQVNMNSAIRNNHFVACSVGIIRLASYSSYFNGNNTIWSDNYTDIGVTTNYVIMSSAPPNNYSRYSVIVKNQRLATGNYPSFSTNEFVLYTDDILTEQMINPNGTWDSTSEIRLGLGSFNDTSGQYNLALRAGGDAMGAGSGNLILDAGLYGIHGTVLIGGQATSVQLQSPLKDAAGGTYPAANTILTNGGQAFFKSVIMSNVSFAVTTSAPPASIGSFIGSIAITNNGILYHIPIAP